jgi:hypothetical protein
MGHRCINCSAPITWRFALCASCEKQFGSKPLAWPAWLRFMWNDVQRERRRNRKADIFETNLEQDDYTPSRRGRYIS